MTSSQRDANFIMPRSLPYCQKTRRANFHRALLWPTSDYQARSPWTEIGGIHLVRDPDYTVDAKEPAIRAPGASGLALS